MTYRSPGKGAIEYTKQFTEGLTQEDALPVISRILSGELIDASDKRVKHCDYCGYYWRDESLRNTRRTCSGECKTDIKTLQRRKQRADKELINPKPRKRTLQDDYIYWLEYPFWFNEYSMIKIGWKFEAPYDSETIDAVSANNQIYGEGNRMRHLSGDKKV